jgi:hypothetical protein
LRTLPAFVLAVALGVDASPASAASALAALAPELAKGLGQAPPHAVVVVSPLVSDVAAPHGEDLAVRLGSLVAGQLGAGAEAHPRCESFSVARALAARGGALVFVQPEVAHGQLRASADLYLVLSNGWDRVRLPLPAPHAHACSSAPLDAEVRTFLAPIPKAEPRVHKMRHDFGDVLAVSCGDVDGDGVNDIVLVTRGSIAWGAFGSGKFVASHAASWSSLASRSPVPLRDPIGAAAIVPRPDGTGSDLFAGTTDRGGVSLSRDLRAASPLVGLPFGGGGGPACVRSSPATGGLEGALLDCGDGSRSLSATPAARYDALAFTELVGRDGETRLIVAARDTSGTLHLRSKQREEVVASVGAQVALADLDQDGSVDIVTTAEAAPDAISVASWHDDGLVGRARIPTQAPIQALAVCPPQDGGPRAIVAVVPGEVWVVR